MPVSLEGSANGPSVRADRLLADAARAAEGARERRATALVDLFLPGASRLSDRQRITMARLLRGLVTAIEDEFRSRLIAALGEGAPEELIAALGTARIEIAAPILDRARLLHDEDLVALLLRRTDAHRLTEGLKRTSDQGDGSQLIDRLIAHDEPAIAAAAMALLIAESRRFDRFGDPLIARTDLPAELQHRLVWLIAAAMRDYMVERHALEAGAVDRPLVATATAMLAGYDEGETLEGRAFGLAVLLQRAGALDDALLAEACGEARLPLFTAALGLRAGVDGTAAWDMVADPSGSRLALLLRAIEVPRPIATGVLLRFAEADGRSEEELVDQLDAFDALDPQLARDALRPWRLDHDYRQAIAALAANGDRAR